MKAVILAAGVGSRLRPITDHTPKGLVRVAGRPILDYALEAFYKAGIGEVLVVTGHLHGQIEAHLQGASIPCRTIYNPRFDTANNYYSLLLCEEAVGREAFVKVDSDLVFLPSVLVRLLSAQADLSVACDAGVALGEEEMKLQVDEGSGLVTGVSKKLLPAACVGESIGMEVVSAGFSKALFDELRAMDAEGFTDGYYEDAYHRIAQRGGADIRAVDVTGLPWSEIDDASDLERASALFADNHK
ncbi:MAG: phosphocholine cytidylyltransferase family protein [Polyangia bacterium]|jgi:choline kinase|nr:phosphocholine cytidylyltransferase family protein [Polyangia bacterium]